jgi:membrane protease YdiL (CAAX protease family)
VDPQTRKAAVILACIAIAESAWVAAQMVSSSPGRLFRYLGFGGPAFPLGWILAAAVAMLWVGVAARLPSVRRNLVMPSWLKLLALALAVSAAICEEAIFRKSLMNAAQTRGYGVAGQLAVSALAFGAAHAVWGLFRGSFRVALSVALVTGALGFLLALVFVASGRNLSPCVVSHFAINLFAEPGLVLAAVRGEMRRA